jgi:DNA-3-methyladenine glycosylase II
MPAAPFRLDLSAWTLRRRSDNAIDHWDGQHYGRILTLPSGPVTVTVAQIKPPEAPKLRVVVRGRSLDATANRQVRNVLEQMLGLGTDLTGFYGMASKDTRLEPLARRFRGMRPPRFANLFEALVNGIACQQVTLTLGIRLLSQLAEKFGVAVQEGDVVWHAFPRPEDLAGLNPEKLRPLGFSGNKVKALLELARAFVDGQLNEAELASLSDEEAMTRLCRLRGVGRWTAEYAMLRGLGRLDIFPVEDAGARNNLTRVLKLKKVLDYDGVRRILGRWHPYGGVVYLHLLLDGLAARGYVS